MARELSEYREAVWRKGAEKEDCTTAMAGIVKAQLCFQKRLSRIEAAMDRCGRCESDGK